MNNLFPGYYRPSDDDLKSLWETGLFVFDTNVLLNLYSYPNEARDIFLSVLHKVAERSWIPYQVALEFHRNRFSRIKQSNKAVNELREKVRIAGNQIEKDFRDIEFEKRNTGIVDLSDRLQAVHDAYTKLEDALNLACDRLPSVSLEDPIGQQVASIFKNRIGSPPIDQAELDTLVSDGSERYEQKIPPGFGDSAKGETYRDKGLLYHGKFGDLILWRQFISHVGASEKRDVIFITGDRKPDWWLTDAGQVLGPLPELVQEFRTKSGATRFWMYSADQFLKYALEFLQAKEVTLETIAQVKETTDFERKRSTFFSTNDSVRISDLFREGSQKNDLGNLDFPINKDIWDFDVHNEGQTLHEKISKSLRYRSEIHDGIEFLMAVQNWLTRIHPEQRIHRLDFPDFSIEVDRGFHGYEVVTLQGFSKQKILARLKRGSHALLDGLLQKFTLVLVFSDSSRFMNDEIYQERLVGNVLDLMVDFPITSVEFGYVESGSYRSFSTLKAPC
jgi:hypothetical protein